MMGVAEGLEGWGRGSIPSGLGCFQLSSWSEASSGGGEEELHLVSSFYIYNHIGDKALQIVVKTSCFSL